MFLFCPEFDILPIFFQESFVFAFLFAFRRKFAPRIPAKFPRNRPFSQRICLFKSREISLFYPRIIRSPDKSGRGFSSPARSERSSLKVEKKRTCKSGTELLNKKQQSLFVLLPFSCDILQKKKIIIKIKLEYWLPGITIGASGAKPPVDINIK